MYTCIMLLKYEKENMAVKMGRATIIASNDIVLK